MNEILQAIANRRSTRHYAPDPVPEAALKAVLEAGLWAPTARNAQEIHMTVLRDPELRAAFKKDLTDYDSAPRLKSFDYQAPVFIFLYGPADFPYTELDTGIVAENMALAAEALGLGTVMIGCIRDFMRSPAAAPWREKLGMSDGDLFTLGLCLGAISAPTASQPRKEGRVLLL